MKRSLLIIILVLFVCLSASSMQGFQSTYNENEKVSTTQVSEPSKSFLQIDMVTLDIGYAITSNFDVLKTVDGGKNWAKVLAVSGNIKKVGKPALSALDEDTLYVAFYSKSGIEVKKSIDGGKSWSAAQIEMQVNDGNPAYGGRLSLNFPDKFHGYLASSSSPAAGLMGKVFYRSWDRGERWSDVGVDLTNVDGYTTGIAFSGKNKGFITCTYHGQQEISVYKTTDRGKKWAVVSMPLPQEYAALTYGNYYADAYPPAFYGKNHKEGKMILYFCNGEKRNAYIYMTENGGTSWNIQGLSNRLMTQYCFLDNIHGFGLDEKGKLYITNNGGNSWSVSN